MYLPLFSVALLIFSSAVHVGEGLQQPAPPGCLHVNTTAHRIVDDWGRERYFHGVNVVVKGLPWLPRTDAFDSRWSFAEKDMQTLQELGLNAIRFGMMWPGGEPQRGQFNETYFNISKSIVNKAAQYGIYTLLDMHQDVLSGKFCGEGAPDWAIDTGGAEGFPWPYGEPYPLDPKTGYPSKEDCAKHNWALGYPVASTSSAFQHIYNNTNGLLDSLAAFWSKVSQEFSSNPYILGYDIINEPWAGDVWEDWTLLWPTVADKKNLAHVYDVVNAEVRKHDRCHNIFFESVTWDELKVGFDHVPGGPEFANRSVLSWHFYVPPLVSAAFSFSERQQDIERLNCAGLLTEFSITNINSGVQQGTLHTMEEADRYFQSWLGWSYKPYADITGDGGSIWNDDGTMNMAIVNDISRTYPQVVAGMSELIQYDNSTRNFSLIYHTTAACTTNTTEIYLNKALHYKSGYTVTVQPSGAASWTSPTANYLHIIHRSNLPEGTVIQVGITPL